MVGKFGEELIFEEALESLGQDIYREALEESELEPYAPGSLEEITREDPLKLRYTVPLAPEVHLGPYRDIRIPFEEAEVTDEAVEDALEGIRQRQALIEPVDRPAEETDLVQVDLSGELLEPEAEEDTNLLDLKDVPLPPSQRSEFSIPDQLEKIILDLLAKNPADRPSTAEELGRRLTECPLDQVWDGDSARQWWEINDPAANNQQQTQKA